MKKLNPLYNWMINKAESSTGHFRDWVAILAWATSIAAVLKETEAATKTESK